MKRRNNSISRSRTGAKRSLPTPRTGRPKLPIGPRPGIKKPIGPRPGIRRKRR